jgi:hypothetical protein
MYLIEFQYFFEYHEPYFLLLLDKYPLHSSTACDNITSDAGNNITSDVSTTSSGGYPCQWGT